MNVRTVVSFVSNTSVHSHPMLDRLSSLPPSSSIPYSSGTNFFFPHLLSPSNASNASKKSESTMYVRPMRNSKYRKTRGSPLSPVHKRLEKNAAAPIRQKTQKQSNWVSKQRPPPSLPPSPADLYHVLGGSRFVRGQVR